MQETYRFLERLDPVANFVRIHYSVLLQLIELAFGHRSLLGTLLEQHHTLGDRAFLEHVLLHRKLPKHNLTVDIFRLGLGVRFGRRLRDEYDATLWLVATQQLVVVALLPVQSVVVVSIVEMFLRVSGHTVQPHLECFVQQRLLIVGKGRALVRLLYLHLRLVVVCVRLGGRRGGGVIRVVLLRLLHLVAALEKFFVLFYESINTVRDGLGEGALRGLETCSRVARMLSIVVRFLGSTARLIRVVWSCCFGHN